ncbi:MAG TPA: DNA topoisomerase I [Nitrososphaerales archaeon]|nr:DNA topoisomerase I [Nitrososphaerales archaeon]
MAGELQDNNDTSASAVSIAATASGSVEEEEAGVDQVGATQKSSKKKGNHWTTLTHFGVCFPEPYKSDPRTSALVIKGDRIQMTPEQEEMAVAWAKKIGTPYVEDPVFQANFLSDFLKLFPEKYRDAKISDIVFPILPEKVELSKEEKKRIAAERKKKRLELKEKFGYAIVDGVRTEIANWIVEPPGLFMGRGSHPMRGHWKPRIHEEDITLNLGKEAEVPPGNWKVIHAPDCMWMACWTDRLSGKVKYVWLHDSSSIRQARDKSKYDKARDLEKHIEKVRAFITKSLSSKNPRDRKVATVCFLIDKLAMRVGDEKDEDEADTVGASTLRVEHLKFNGNTIDFDFYGKDYVRWQKSLSIDPKDKAAIDNLKEFCAGKKPEDLIFDGITSRHVNDFLGGAFKGLTAKVFRTFHATTAVRQYLQKHSRFSEATPEFDKVFEAKMANFEAAVKCNHKRTPPKTFEQTLQKKEEKLHQLKEAVPKTEKQKEKLAMRIKKMSQQIDLAKQTRDYNLNTSLRNYIDPRVYKSWADRVGLDWKVLYTGTLQRKMAWVDSFRTPKSSELPKGEEEGKQKGREPESRQASQTTPEQQASPMASRSVDVAAVAADEKKPGLS